jgi:hypothetical protein
MTPFQKKRRFPSSLIRMIYMVFELMLLDMPPIIMSDVEKAQFWRRSGNYVSTIPWILQQRFLVKQVETIIG